jgi:hypothetical protein
LQIIDFSILKGCEEVTELIIPQGELNVIQNQAFSKIKVVEITENVTSIGLCVFMKCIQLNEANLPQHIKEISDFLFMYCAELEKVNIPLHVKKIGNEAFFMCRQMKIMHLPKALRHIKMRAFLSNGVVILNIPQAVHDIEEEAFRDCKIF